MDWTDLQLPPDVEQTLRHGWGVSDPKQVVALAWNAPAQLASVMPAAMIDRVRRRWSQSQVARFDSSDFALGAQLGTPAADVRTSDDFETRRGDLISRLATASDPGEKTALESDLLSLYRTQAASQ